MTPNWQKFYQGRFSFLVCFLGLDCYFETFRKEIGICFDHAFVSYEKGITTCYLAQQDIEKIVTFILGKIETDDGILNEWVDRLNKATDESNKYFARNPQELLKPDVFVGFKEAVFKFSVYKFINTEIGNHLEKNVLDKYSAKIEAARKYSEKFYFELTKACADILSEIEKKENYPLNLLECLTLKELELYLVGKNPLPDKKVLESRFNFSGILYSPNSAVLGENETRRILDEIFKETNTKEIKGNTAYPGRVTGICRVIRDFREADLNQGDILVTGMTDPNFVPLMKKAGAIITDAGGILCHAAIVSRELKKPCIIGTQIATQVLKDGDMVEVDADKGLVKILK